MNASSQSLTHAARYARLAALALAAAAGTANAQPYFATQLTTNVCCGPEKFDPNLAGGMGIASGRAGATWVTIPHTGRVTLYNGLGDPQALVVRLQPIEEPQLTTPTGIAANATGEFLVSNGTGVERPAAFIFATEEGTITAWAPAPPPNPQNTTAFIVVNKHGSDPVPAVRYTGLAIASTPDGGRLYAADVLNRRIDVFDGDYSPVDIAFTDPNLPAGLAPYNVRVLGGEVYIAYALADAHGDIIRGPGQGVVDVYRTDGTLRRRIATGGRLNAPWGMVIAPDNFGPLSGALLVANTGDGKINAWNPQTGAPLPAITDRTGNAIALDGLKGIEFGNGALSAPTNALYFTTSPDFGVFGVFGRIDQACPADADRNGRVDPADVAAFITTWLDSIQTGSRAGDFDGDTAVVPADIARFVSAWLTAVNAGGC